MAEVRIVEYADTGILPKFASRVLRVVREKGIHYLLSASVNKIKARLSPSLDLWYFKIFKSWKQFSLQGKKYKYFYHKFNTTWRNERAVEIPIIWDILENRIGSVLEIGNVLQHYFRFHHDIVDKYEKGDGVINEDVVDLHLPEKYDVVVSISTIEHIGFDENPVDRREKMNTAEKILQAIDNMKKSLNPGGRIVLTFPVGFNPSLDAFLQSGRIKFEKILCMKRVSKDNRWTEVEFREIESSLYGSPYPFANGLVVGTINV